MGSVIGALRSAGYSVPQLIEIAKYWSTRTRQFVEWLRKGRPAPGADRVRLAGEPERETRAKRERGGIPVDDNTWKEILAAAAKVKLDPAQIEKLARS